MDVLALLRSENRCLEKLLGFSREFLAAAIQGDWTGLAEFDRRRAVFFKALDLLDRQISAAAEPKRGRLTPEEESELRRIGGLRDAIVGQILETDGRLMRELEREQALTAAEANSVRKSRNTLSKFKSSWVPRLGSEMDSQV